MPKGSLYISGLLKFASSVLRISSCYSEYTVIVWILIPVIARTYQFNFVFINKSRDLLSWSQVSQHFQIRTTCQWSIRRLITMVLMINSDSLRFSYHLLWTPKYTYLVVSHSVQSEGSPSLHGGLYDSCWYPERACNCPGRCSAGSWP